MSLFSIEQEYFNGKVKIISPTTFSDARGSFSISYREDFLNELGLPNFVQDNHSRSMKGVVRGLHFQTFPEMGKLMRVTRGRAFFVAVDFDESSRTYLSWVSTEVSEDNRLQVWAPWNFLRGFCALEDNTEVQYKCSAYFNTAGDKAIRWDDPDIEVIWPVKDPYLSIRDINAPTVREYRANR